MDRFLQLFGRFVQFSYACWDRIVLRGYYPRLETGRVSDPPSAFLGTPGSAFEWTPGRH